MLKRRFSSTLIALICLAPAALLAHPGHAGHGSDGGLLMSLLAGLAHPVTGLDHLLAALAVGIWAYHLGGKSLVRLPLVFLGAMLLGAAGAGAGLALPGLEVGIALSVFVLGALVCALTRGPWLAGAALVAAFGLFHGNAHVLEMPAHATMATYLAGMILATALLHGAGVLLAQLATRAPSQAWVRVAGGVTAVAGVLMMGVVLV